MSILDFQKPDKIVMLESTDFNGTFEFRPLEPGYGVTIGNSLRRVLLSSLEGYAICAIKIDGVEHEFSTVKGVSQDVTEMILNLKQVRIAALAEDIDQEKVSVVVSGKDQLVAGDINKFLTNFKVLNEDLVICDLDPNVELNIELFINKGRGYVPSFEQEDSEDLGIINIDSIYTPIVNVKYTIEDFRVEQRTDYEKLIFDIQTDGSITPRNAIKEASRLLIRHLMLLSDEEFSLEDKVNEDNIEFDEEALHLRQLLQKKLTELNLSVRALNCLKTANISTLGELVRFQKADLLKFRNFGKKSLNELDELLENNNLQFGMNLDKYKLD
jgi:DNA-directed RNA polymerase subunit alpha